MEPEIDVDALVNNANAPEIPMHAPGEGEALGGEQKQSEASSSTDGRSLIYKGQEISINDDKYRSLAQKGYSYEKDMHQLKVDRKLWEHDQKKQSSEMEELRKIQDYAVQNPQFQSLIQREWAKIQGGGGLQDDDQQSTVSGTDSQLSAILDRLNQQDNMNRAREEADKEATLETSVEKYKDAYGSFDWGSKDENGQTLEDKIMDYALEQKIPSFKTAANDYLFDEHVKRASITSKETAAKSIQNQHKLGLGKVTSESQLKVKKAEGVRNKSYNQIAAEALKELGLG